MSTLAKRLRDARLQAELSQEQLGIDAGLEPASASTRMNRYELGKRMPDPTTVEKFGEVLNLPAAYFYAVDDQEAELLTKFHRLPRAAKKQLLQFVDDLGVKK